MPQSTNTLTDATLQARIAKVQDAMKASGIQALLLEPGPAMMYLTGVRWGRSERAFAVVVPLQGDPAYVLPGFEEMRARELIRIGRDIRVWQEDDSPYQLIADILKKNAALKIGVDASVRFFVFDGVRMKAPKAAFVAAGPVLRTAGVDLALARGR